MARFDGYTVQREDAQTVIDLVSAIHYSHNCRTGIFGYGLRNPDGQLAGAIAITNPVIEAARVVIFGPILKYHVYDLHRMVKCEGVECPTSWFVMQALKAFKRDNPKSWAVISYADSAQDHLGTVYQACNAIYYGMSKPEPIFEDSAGIRHARRLGATNLTTISAFTRGLGQRGTSRKHRYVFLTPSDRRDRIRLEKLLRVPRLKYPKRAAT